MIRRFFLVLLVAAACGLQAFPGTARAGLEEGRLAYQAGDYARAFREFLPLAEAGDVPAQNQVAVMYYVGQGAPQDYAKAVEWFRKAAEHGSPDAQYLLGKLYLLGQGAPKNEEEAVKWLTEAALYGKVGAQNLAALCYLEGRGVDKNVLKAYFWAYVASQAAGAAEGDKAAAARLRERVEKELTERQKESVRRMAAEWSPRKR